MPTLLQQWTFDGEVGTVNLSTHDAGWVYDGDPDRYQVFATGFTTAKSTLSDPNSIASHDYDVPVGTSVRLVADIVRVGADAPGGAIEFNLYYRDAARGTIDTTDRLQLLVRRTSVNGVLMAATWYKSSLATPPTVTITSASLVHVTGSGRRYIWDVDESTGFVRQYVADVATGANAVLVSGGGGLDASLVGHGAGDRHGAYATRNAGSGLVGFWLYHLELYDLESVPVLVGPDCEVLLQVYEDDGVTVAWEVGTWATHANPYLVHPDQLGEQEIDFARGAASLGTVRWAIADKNLIAEDQDSGFLTGKLASFGIPNLGGKRMRMIRFIPDGPGYQILADGPSSQPRMAPDYSSFEGEIRDTREIERKVRMFDLVSESGPAAISGALPAATMQTGTDSDIIWNADYHS